MVKIKIGEIEVTGVQAAAIGNEGIIGRDVLNHLIVELNGLGLDFNRVEWSVMRVRPTILMVIAMIGGCVAAMSSLNYS